VLFYLRVGVADEAEDAAIIHKVFALPMRIDQNAIFDNVVDVAKQEAPPAVQLLLVETSLKVVISEGNSHEAMNVLRVLPEDQACLILDHGMIVVDGRCYSHPALPHKIDILSTLSLLIYLFGIIFFENLYKFDVRFGLIIEDLIRNHGVYGPCSALSVLLRFVTVAHGD
jgi:hypothetical protein